MEDTMRRIAAVLTLGFLASAGGCCGFPGDRVLERRLRIDQDVHTDGGLAPEFRIDASRLPADWIESRTIEEDRCYSKSTHIQLDGRHAVKVIVVPAEADMP